MNIEIINPIDCADWDELLRTSEHSTFFQTSAWADVLSTSYGYRPLYFTIKENGRLSSLAPIMEVNSFLTGKRGVSLPFTDESAPIFECSEQRRAVIDALIQHGRSAGWRYFELRGAGAYLNQCPHSSSYYTHDLDLTPGEAEIRSNLRKSNWRNIKRARKEGVTVVIANTWESVQAFYRLNCITRKHHGLPPQPVFFFKRLFEKVIATQKGFIALASCSDRLVAGAVFLLFGPGVIYKYGASDRKYQHLRANNLVMWEAINWCIAKGFSRFSFGRTEPENKGLLQFKRGWGPREGELKYYRYDFKKASFVSGDAGPGTSYGLFKKMPVPFLKFIGGVLYRHVG